MAVREQNAARGKTARRTFNPPPLLSFALRRLGALILLLIGLTFITFVLTALVPGDPARAALGPIQGENEEAVRAWREKNGLDRALPVRFGIYVWHLLHGDLGTSQRTNSPVRHDLSIYIPATVELAVTSIVIAAVVGMALGLIAALRKDKFTDQAVRVVSLGGISMPPFWIALSALYIGFFKLGWFPIGGRLSTGVNPPTHVTGLYVVDALISGDTVALRSAVWHLMLPALVLAAYTIGYIARYTRTAVLEVLHNDYVLAADAKGLPRHTVVFRYILRAAMPSMIQILGFAFAAVLTGAVLIESILSWPGLGQYAYQSAQNVDLPSIAAVTLFIAIVYVVINFLVDIAYSIIDPRIRIA
jgi:peptide/nickel transport system permease protein